MSKQTKLSEFRIRTVDECNGLVVLHLEHLSGSGGRTKRRFYNHGDLAEFVKANKIKGEL